VSAGTTHAAALQFFYNWLWLSVALDVTVAHPRIERPQGLSKQMTIEARNRVPSAAANGKNGHSLISDAKFRRLYELALKLHLAGERTGERTGNGLVWLRGREAVFAGVAADLRDGDVVVAEYTSSVEEIARGHVPVRVDRRSFEERVIEALSDAVGDRMRKTGRITAVFLDGAGGELFEEARRLANAAKLPVLFVEEQQKARGANGKKKQPAFEYPSIPVDTQDVIAMYRVAHESITRARDGGGPTHIVGVRWKLAASGQKRGAKAAGGNASGDAVEHLEQWLIARGLPVQEWRREIVAEFEANARGQRFASQASEGLGEDEETETRAIA
jgi:TPP-dependent pyruvate/acetoin dehydrogenase alpha subunit